MLGERGPNVQKIVDKYYLPHFYHHLQHQHNSNMRNAKEPHCELCFRLQSRQAQNQSDRGELLLTQDDIDLLELMDPKITPEAYMRSILRLYRREENLRPREQCTESMQHTLSTRKQLNSQGRLLQSPSLVGVSPDEGLDEQEQTRQELLDRAQICRLRDECYLGLGRMIVQRKEIHNRSGLSKSSYHTRQYLMPQVDEEVKRRQADNANRGEHTFYLLANANSRGIYFPVDHMPQSLAKVLEFDRFREVVCTLNGIIQQTVYQHRTKASHRKRMNAEYGWQWVWLLGLVTLLIVNSLTVGSQALSELCLVGALCLVIYILMVSCHRFRQQPNFISLVDLLNIKITDYLSYLNSRPGSKLYWKTEEQLYWIEITLNKEPH